MTSIILGCGDVGLRIARQLRQTGIPREDIIAYVRSVESAELCARKGVTALRLNLDSIQRDLGLCNGADLFYTVPPPKEGVIDSRSEALLEFWQATNVKPRKVVLISTTGVYGDCEGGWVTEESVTRPQTDRGKRRLHSEQLWQSWSRSHGVSLVILRVPGIYAFSRLPVERLKRRTPVVTAKDCGFSNRVHADDLARIGVLCMQKNTEGVFNATDGAPGKISEYLQAAALALGMQPLPEISMQQAQSELSQGMLSYLSESRKISNQKILCELNIKLLYPDFRKGIKEG